MLKYGLAINKLAEKCVTDKFLSRVIILEEYDTIYKIQLEHESGFNMITLTEKFNITSDPPFSRINNLETMYPIRPTSN